MSITLITDAKATSFAFLELKSYGDLVITAYSIRMLGSYDLDRCCVLIGPHLRDLAASLALPCAIKLLQIDETNVPALFDLKKRGLTAGLKSAFAIRTALASAVPGFTLVVTRSSYRERFILGTRSIKSIPRAENVYKAYERFMCATFQEIMAASTMRKQSIKRIGLCPFSRVSSKNLPPFLVNILAKVCTYSGFEPELILLDGEQWDNSLSEFSIRTINRCFKSLAETLEEYAGVISADSLPAHLAEFRGTPAFVVSPVPNSYWLPKRAFEGQYWGVIDNPTELSLNLKRFLHSL